MAGGSSPSGPGQDFQRWLDGIKRRGHSVAYDPEGGSIDVSGERGKLRLYVKRGSKLGAGEKERGPNLWKLACGVGGTFVVYKAYSEEAAGAYFACWVVLCCPWIIIPVVGCL